MKHRSKRHLMLLLIAFLVLATWRRFSEIGSDMLPFWVILAAAGAVFSGYMWLKTSREEREEEQKWIEQEGRIFIRRMENERERRERPIISSLEED